MPHPPGFVLGTHQYGKAEVRLVRVTRDTSQHAIEDLNVTTQMRGAALDESYYSGDNSLVHATDSQKNTIYAFAKRFGVRSPERFLLTLASHFMDAFPQYDGCTLSAEQYGWSRITADGAPHDHSFVRTGGGTRTSVVQRDAATVHVLGGVTDLTVLKSGGSEFHGFPRTEHTTLGETADRVLATDVTARWRYVDAAADTADFDDVHDRAVAALLEAFATVHSLALQQTLFAMGRAVLEACPELAEVRLAMPNNHHFPVDLAPFGLTNDNEVLFAADRPYGLINGSVVRDGEPAAPGAWVSVPGFL
jgi:urate oxidase